MFNDQNITRSVPLLLRTIHSAPSGLYPLQSLVDKAWRLGYHTIGIADIETLAAAGELLELSEQYRIRPVCGMEVSFGEAQSGGIILLALGPEGYHQLLQIHLGLHTEAYRQQGLPGLPADSAVDGKGLACLVDSPGTLKDIDIGEWRERLNSAFRKLPKAEFYLRLGPRILNQPSSERLHSALDLATRTGITPAVVHVAAFVDPLDAALYSIGRQVSIEVQYTQSESQPRSAPPTLDEPFFQDLYLPDSESLDRFYSSRIPSPTENGKRLVERIDPQWQSRRLHRPQIELERGFNPETGLWDRLQEAASKRWPKASEKTRERLYREFSLMRKEDRLGQFLVLCEMFSKLRTPGLVRLPEKITHGLLSAYLMGLTPFDPLDFGEPAHEDAALHLDSPLTLHVADGHQKELLEILIELFGHGCVAAAVEPEICANQTLRNLPENSKPLRHPMAQQYLRRCAYGPPGSPRWALCFSHSVESELPVARDDRLPEGCSRLCMSPDSLNTLPAIAFELIPDNNLTRLGRLVKEGQQAVSQPAAISSAQMKIAQEIFPLLYPRYSGTATLVAFQLMKPESWGQLVATLGLIELERLDPNGFQRAVKLLQLQRQSGGKRTRKLPLMQEKGEALSDVLAPGQGLFLFRDQLQPFLQRVLGLPEQTAASLVHDFLGIGSRLPSTDQLAKQIAPLLSDPDLSYPLTQFLSMLPRHLSSRQPICEMAATLALFASHGQGNPGAFASVLLDEASSLQTEIPQTQMYLQRRGWTLWGPDINKSDRQCRVDGKNVWLGLTHIENIGPVIGSHIVEVRGSRPFVNLDDLHKRTRSRLVHKGVLRQLVYSGALDCFEPKQPFFEARRRILDSINHLGKATTEQEAKLQTFLFDVTATPTPEKKEEPGHEKQERVELVLREIEMFGIPSAAKKKLKIDSLLPVVFDRSRPKREARGQGERFLVAGVVRDIWSYGETGKQSKVLAFLHTDEGIVPAVAAEKSKNALLDLRQKDNREKPPELLLVYGRFQQTEGGGWRDLLKKFLGRGPGDPLHPDRYLLIEDFELLVNLDRNAEQRQVARILLDHVPKGLVQEVESWVAPFRLDPKSDISTKLQFQSASNQPVPEGLKDFEKLSLLPSEILLRGLNEIEGIREGKFSIQDS